MFAAAELHDDLSIDCVRRIDVFRAIPDLGIHLMFRPLNRCAGVYLPGVEGRAGILVHQAHPLPLQRYSAGHELGHHVFGHGHQIDRPEALTRSVSGSWSDEEMLAEAFAAWFLMPPELVDSSLTELRVSNPRSPQDAYALSLRLGTSYTATCLHLLSLNMVSRGDLDVLLATSPKEIKQSLVSEYPAMDWRADVWVVRAGSPERPLRVSEGDRILLRLDDNRLTQHQPQLEERTVAAPDHRRVQNNLPYFDVPRDVASRSRRFVLAPCSGSDPFPEIEVEVESRTTGLFVRNDEACGEHDEMRICVGMR
jgi:uncharacterized protein DUF955